MSDNVMELNSSNFDSVINKGNWVIDFWADWCMPCKAMAPHFEAAAKELKGKVGFAKVNVDKVPDVAQRFDIMSIPTMIFFKSKEQVNRTSGAMHKEAILKLAEESF